MMTFDQTADFLRQHGLDKEHQEHSELGGQSLHPGYMAALCVRCRQPFMRARNKTDITDCGQCDRPIVAG